MSPAKFYDDQQVKGEINAAPRPSTLKINKESHMIHKSSSQSSSSSNSSLFTGIAGASTKQHPQQQPPQPQPQPQPQRHQPVIIYTHSPKIIHTNVRDFMSLVQKLTGLSHSDEDESVHVQAPSVHGSSPEGHNANNNKINGTSNEDTTSSSVVTDENCGGITDAQVNSSSITTAYDPLPNSYLSDIPFYAPNPSELFCPSQPYYRYPDPMFTSTNINTSMSPSVLQRLKGFPDYCN